MEGCIYFMLNYLWGFMIIIGVAFGIITGQAEAISNASIDSAKDAVTLSITMLGIMAMWTGIIEIARQSGLMERMTKGLGPLLHFLFPRIPAGHQVNEYIAANMIANILGLGWAATPMGLKAMRELAIIQRMQIEKQIEQLRISTKGLESQNERKIDRLKKQLTRASDEMCTFLVINISSLQVIPVSVIAYRSQYGSVNPVAIVVPGLIATGVSTLVGVVFCKIMQKSHALY